MKKTIMAIAAAMMMSMGAMAQETTSAQQGGAEPRQMDRAEMVKQSTERMVTEYGLNEEQAAKLLELNTQYADKVPMMMMGRGQRGGQRAERQDGQRAERQDGQRAERRDGQRMQRQGGERGQRPQMNREEMMKNMEAYNAEVEKIMTAEQFKKYKEAQQMRGQRGGQRGGQFGGQRQQR